MNEKQKEQKPTWEIADPKPPVIRCGHLENLKENRDKTVILITHRRAALDICDTVLTLKKGKIKHS